MIDVFPGYFAKNLFSLMSTKSGNSFSFWQVMEINRFSLPKFFKKRERFEPVKSYYYRLSQYQISTSLHKYEVKLFSATFLEQKKCLFDFILALYWHWCCSLDFYLSYETPCFKIRQKMCLRGAFEN